MRENTFNNFITKVSKKSKLRPPRSIIFEITERCNLNCDFCFMGSYRNRKQDMDMVEVLDVIDQLENVGCMKVVLTGGEPLIRKDFEQIYKYIQEKGMMIIIYTNGTLITEKKAEFFEKYPPLNLKVGLQAGSKKKYEKITGNSESFKSIIRGARRLKERKINFSFRSVITTFSIDEIDSMKKIADNFGVPLWIKTNLLQNSDGDKFPNLKINSQQKEILKKKTELQSMINQDEINKKNRECSGCIYINNSKKVQICPVIRNKKVYDLNKESFRKVWKKKLNERINIMCPII